MASRVGFDRDMPTRLQLMSEGRLAVSKIDSDRRMAIMLRRPEKFVAMTSEQKRNFVADGMSNEDGHLDEWLHQHYPLSAHRNMPQLGKGGAFLIDHLPRRSLAYRPISVPWTGSQYAGEVGSFFEYPELMGFNRYELELGSFGEHTEAEGLAFLQSWLFFGLLQEALGSDSLLVYERWIENFESETSETKNMKSPNLARYLDVISQRLSNKRERPPWEYWEEVFKLAITVAEAFDSEFGNQYPANTGPEEPISLRITWSLLTLGQMVTIVAMMCFGIEESPIERWPDSILLQRRLRSREWCPHLRNKLMGILSMDVLYSLSLMSWYNPVNEFSALSIREAEHTRADVLTDQKDYTTGIGRHMSCSVAKCFGEKIDDKLYRTSHVKSDCDCGCLGEYSEQNCQCNFVGPIIDDVIHILNDREVPVFFVRQFMDECGILHVSVEVRRSDSVAGYVAISHVWADGLGNKVNNKLPLCQVIRIVHMLRDFTGKDCPPFWIDTFGIPRELEQRKKALAVMNATYRLSERVLVLDGGLQQFSSYRALYASVSDIDVEIAEQVRMGICVELLLRILCSSWTSRLWTLPEGMLGPELHFMFSDGTAELGELFAQLKTWPFIGTHLVQDLRSFFVRLRPLLRSQPRLGLPAADPGLLFWPSSSPSGRCISMFQALEQRDTSWKEDEAICLGIHLDLSVGEITAFKPDEEKLQALFAQIDEIPSDIMFTHAARLPRRPYRWAPLHLLQSMNNYCCLPAASPSRPIGQRTDRGLRVKLNSFQLATKNEYAPNSKFIFFTCIPTDARGRIPFPPDIPVVELGCNYSMQLAAQDPRLAKDWTQSNTSKLLDAGGETAENIYVLIGPEGFRGPPANAEQGKVCLVVKRESLEDGILYGTPLDTVIVYRIPGFSSVRPEVANSTSFVHLQGIEVPDRVFCIG